MKLILFLTFTLYLISDSAKANQNIFKIGKYDFILFQMNKYSLMLNLKKKAIFYDETFDEDIEEQAEHFFKLLNKIEKKNIGFHLRYSIHQVNNTNKAYHIGQNRNFNKFTFYHLQMFKIIN